MTRRTCVVAVLWLAGLVPRATAQVDTPSRFAPVRTVLEAARVETGSPGVSVAIVEHDTLVWSAGLGLADIEHETPATAATVYRIASISKPIAATAVMQLVERGRVNLGDPIQRYVPAFPRKGETTITIRHLLSHTSGIRHYNPGEMENREPFTSIDAAIAIFRDDPLLFTPGSRYGYSSYAFNLLAGVVERASGLGYEAYLHEHVFTPAGMRDTRLEHPDEIVKGRARQYVRAGGDGGTVHNAPYADLSIKWAGGGIISTVEDLARFHVALDQGRLLKAATLEEMYAPTRLTTGTLTGYGLGWMTQTDRTGRRWVAHAGGATGGTTYLLRCPEIGFAVVLLFNVESAPRLGELAERIASQVLGAELFEPSTKAP